MADKQTPPHLDTSTQNERLSFALQAAQVGTWELDIANQSCWLDACCQDLYGVHQDDIVSYEQFLSCVHADDRQRVKEAVAWALDPQSAGHYDVHFRVLGAEEGQLRWLHCRGRAYFDQQGQPYRFSGTAQDITQLLQTRQQFETSEARFINLVQNSPAGTVVFTGRDMVVQAINERMLQLWGKTRSVVGRTLHEAMPELMGQPFLDLMQRVYDTGQAYHDSEGRATIAVEGSLREFWFDLTYDPLYDANGVIYGVINTATDVTEKVRAKEALLESNQNLDLALQTGDLGAYRIDLQTHTATFSESIGQWFGLSQLQLPMAEIITRVFPDDQAPVLEALRQAAANQNQGRHEITYRMMSPADGQLRYLRSVGQVYFVDQTPLFMLGVIQDVTRQVLAHQQLQQVEQSLREVIELAELGTWTLDPVAGQFSCSDRLRVWMGDEAVAGLETVFEALAPADRERIQAAIRHALTPQSGGVFDEQCRLINRQTGQQRIFHARGKTDFDEQGNALRLSGATRDVTREHELKLALEQQVQARTQELQLANADLKRSNDNLQQFAYIASHDLQEPLRKIQSFSSLLAQQFKGDLTESGLDYIERITGAGARMSTLIKDLLTYSRISTRQQVFGRVSLDAILAGVLYMLDLTIAESGAQLELPELPVVKGDELQLSQLFQNLLSNAIKFTPAEQIPQISVRCSRLHRNELPAGVHPTSEAAFYYQISVQDQGIGFDEKYLDRIFQVFQRLHGKSEFPGTGVGLAICQRVAENHGGAIMAASQPGKGATFCVYLPG